MQTGSPQFAPGAHVRHFISLGIAQLCMGSGAVFGRVALAGGHAFAVAAARMILVSTPLVIRQLVVDRRTWGRPIEARLAVAATLLGAQFFFWTQALSRLSVAATTLLVCCTPLWNGLFDVFILHRRLPVSFWAAMAVAMSGIGLLVTAQAPSEVPIAGQTALGVALACGCSLASASYLLLVRRVTQLKHHGVHPPMSAVLSRTFTGAALVLTALCILARDAPPDPHAETVWLSIAGMALVTQGFGHGLQNVALKYLPARIVSFATLIEPLIATAVAAIFFGESITAGAIGGGILMMVGVGWAMGVGDI